MYYTNGAKMNGKTCFIIGCVFVILGILVYPANIYCCYCKEKCGEAPLVFSFGEKCHTQCFLDTHSIPKQSKLPYNRPYTHQDFTKEIKIN
jgi:hypothetical protein